jgi:hypothetical protein
MGELDRSPKTRARRQQQEWANKTPFIYSLRQTKGGSRKFGGWSNDGMRRYRELVHMVRADRETLQTKTALRLVTRPTVSRERGSIAFIKAEAQQ